jgi:hypothetical protein
MDIAPYINAARTLDLFLIGGVTEKDTDGHDWNNILTMLNLFEGTSVGASHLQPGHRTDARILRLGKVLLLSHHQRLST